MNQKLSVSGRTVAFALLAILYLPGCSESTDAKSQVSTEKSVALAGVAETGAVAKKPAQNKGTVKSNQAVGGYSYLEVDIAGQIFWLATSISAVKPGARIAWNDYAMMTNFKSQALNREFSQILFVDRIMAESDLASRSHSGTVIETMNSAGYSYIRVEENGARVWLAAPETRIEIGQSIRWSGGTAMRNFTSQSLNRNFDEIFFVDAIQDS